MPQKPEGSVAVRQAKVVEAEPLSPAAHAFVLVVFTALGASFIASTVQLYLEFRMHDWKSLLAAHSHLFFFFPIFGLLALAAFYIPCVVFTDFYWRRASDERERALGPGRWGPARFIFGTVVVSIVALWFTTQLSGEALRGVWEVSPAAMQDDRATEVPGCRDERGQACVRQPILATLQDLRAKAMDRRTITEFARPCSPDPLLEEPATFNAIRYCFPARARMTAANCCLVQAEFARAVAAKHANVKLRSTTSRFEEAATFAKSFFIVVLVVVSALLVFWQDKIQHLYPGRLDAIERGIIVGSVAMLFWLLMDYGYQQTADVLFGRAKPGFPVRLSVIVAFWSVLLIVYFLKSVGRTLFNVAQVSTIVASGVAVFQYEQIMNMSVSLLGIGARETNFVILLCIALLALQLVYGRWRLPLPRKRARFEQLT